MLEDKLREILEDCFKKRNDLFLIDFKVVNANEITVTVDGDNGVAVEDCIHTGRPTPPLPPSQTRQTFHVLRRSGTQLDALRLHPYVTVDS